MAASLLGRSVSAIIALGMLTACAGAFSSGSPATSSGELPAGRRLSLRPFPGSASMLYLASRNNARIVEYPISGNGNIAPSVTITGLKTKLKQPVALALSSTGKIYTANDAASEVLIFAAGASGNATPTVLGGSRVPLSKTEGIALDASDNIYVSDYSSKQILVFAAGATGNTAPIRTIKGSKTKLYGPIGMALDSAGDLFVVNGTTPSNGYGIVEFAPGANGNVAPTSHIGGSKVMLVFPASVSIDSKGRIIVPSGGNAVLIFKKGSNGNVAPSVVITGSKTMLGGATTAGVDASDEIFVTECCVPGTVLVFASTAKGNVAPIRSIAGKKTKLDDPFYPSFH